MVFVVLGTLYFASCMLQADNYVNVRVNSYMALCFGVRKQMTEYMF